MGKEPSRARGAGGYGTGYSTGYRVAARAREVSGVYGKRGEHLIGIRVKILH